MGIEERKFFVLICDNCEEEYAENCDISFSVYHTEKRALKAGKDSGWNEEDGEWFCEGCQDSRNSLAEQRSGEGEVLGR